METRKTVTPNETIEELADRTCTTYEGYKNLREKGLEMSWITKENGCAKEVRNDLFGNIHSYYEDLEKFFSWMDPCSFKIFLQQMMSWREEDDDSTTVFEFLIGNDHVFEIDWNSGLTWSDVIRMFIKYDRIDLVDLMMPYREQCDTLYTAKPTSYLSRMCKQIDPTYNVSKKVESTLSSSEINKVVTWFVEDVFCYWHDREFLKSIKSFVGLYGDWLDVTTERCWDIARKEDERSFVEMLEYEVDDCFQTSYSKEQIEQYDCNCLYNYVHQHFPADSLSEEYRKQFVNIYDWFLWMDGVECVDDDVTEFLAREGSLFECNPSRKYDESLERVLVNKGYDDDEIEHLKSLSKEHLKP